MIDIEKLKIRAGVLRLIRKFFDERDFIEVETPVRINAPAPEPHIDCPVASPGYLRASPELQMKKLLASGMERIWQMGPCFREGEKGSRHNPEFTMLEWYRANADYSDIMRDMEELIKYVLSGIARNANADFSSKSTDPACCDISKIISVPFNRLTVREAYQKFAGWNPFESWDQDRFDYDMATKIEPNLPKDPVFLTDYPPPAASLSKLRGEVAERWELYINGIELANAFTELTDATEQRRRFEIARDERMELGESDYPLDEEFLRLLQFMPPSGGVALGVDRLVMLAASADSISHVRVMS